MEMKGGSVVSMIIFSILLPYLYKLVRAEANHLLKRALRIWYSRVGTNDVIRVRSDPRSDLFRRISLYLDSKVREIGVLKNANMSYPSNKLNFRLEDGETLSELFRGVPVKWTLTKERRKSHGRGRGYTEEREYLQDAKCLLLRMSNKQRDLQREYLLHISKTVIEDERKQVVRSLFTCRGGRWAPGNEFRHPASFDSVAMEPEVRSRIMSDLQEFLTGKEYYERVGKAWKRGYLLYGPPGTGKSSLIAAIAKHISYNVYVMDLSVVRSNENLRRLLMTTGKKSVIVMEDIDCCFTTGLSSSRESEGQPSSNITLSGLLNFCDGLWSGTDAERVFIFTTNHIEKLDPALLRRGRMDLHICMSYCKANAFRHLMSMYLRIQEHQLLPEIEELLNRVDVTPADVTELLLSNRGDPDAALCCVFEFLRERLNARTRRTKGCRR